MALSPPLGFLPSLRCQAAVFATIYQVCLNRRLSSGCITKYSHQRVDRNVLVVTKFLELYFLNLMFLFHLQSHFLSANALRVGLPFGLVIGPGMPPILAQNDFRRFADAGDLAACFAETGGFKFMPWAFAERRPAAFNPPLGFLPSLRCQAAVLAITCTS